MAYECRCPLCNMMYNLTFGGFGEQNIPVLLDCGHEICDKCVQKSDNLFCVLCKRKYDKNDKVLSNPYTVAKLLFSSCSEQLSRFQNSSEKCVECNNFVAECHCMNCDVLYCYDCYSMVHNKSAVLRRHKKSDLGFGYRVNLQNQYDTAALATLFSLFHIERFLLTYNEFLDEKIQVVKKNKQHTGNTNSADKLNLEFANYFNFLHGLFSLTESNINELNQYDTEENERAPFLHFRLDKFSQDFGEFAVRIQNFGKELLENRSCISVGSAYEQLEPKDVVTEKQTVMSSKYVEDMFKDNLPVIESTKQDTEGNTSGNNKVSLEDELPDQDAVKILEHSNFTETFYQQDEIQETVVCKTEEAEETADSSEVVNCDTKELDSWVSLMEDESSLVQNKPSLVQDEPILVQDKPLLTQDKSLLIQDELLVQDASSLIVRDDGRSASDVDMPDKLPAVIISKSWLPPKRLKRRHFLACVTYVDDDMNIYLHDAEHAGVLESVNEALNSQYQKLPHSSIDSFYCVNEPCIVKRDLDNKWYRAEIVEVYAGVPKAKVLFIDYGNTEICDLQHLRKEIILSDVPIFCHKFKLTKLIPISEDGVWSNDVVDAVYDSIVDQRCRVTISQLKDGSNQIDALTIPSTRFDLFDEMVSQKFARYKEIDCNALAEHLEYNELQEEGSEEALMQY